MLNCVVDGRVSFPAREVGIFPSAITSGAQSASFIIKGGHRMKLTSYFCVVLKLGVRGALPSRHGAKYFHPYSRIKLDPLYIRIHSILISDRPFPGLHRSLALQTCSI
jgi:hypothetical protein